MSRIKKVIEEKRFWNNELGKVIIFIYKNIFFL